MPGRPHWNQKVFLSAGFVESSVERLRTGRNDPGEGGGCSAAERGYPERIRSDNGTEFISHAMAGWAEQHGVELEFIQPGTCGRPECLH